jgi:hypothetical protein
MFFFPQESYALKGLNRNSLSKKPSCSGLFSKLSLTAHLDIQGIQMVQVAGIAQKVAVDADGILQVLGSLAVLLAEDSLAVQEERFLPWLSSELQ